MIHYLRVLVARLRGLCGDQRAERELEDEIETHLRLLAERYVRQGMSEAEAAWDARRQFGNVTLLKEVRREMHGIRLIETFIQDLRYGARTLLKTPGFTLIIVITLALGIGVNTVILSTMNGFLLRTLAVEKPAELMSVFWGKKSDLQVWEGFSYPNYNDVRNRAQSFTGLAAWNNMYNVANLMLARAAARAKEIGIRLAIGAGRWRIVRQLLTESVLLSLLGGAMGWLLAYWGTWLVAASVPPLPWPVNLQVEPDGYVLKWMLGLSLLTGMIFGLAPALLASRPDLVAVIKGHATGQSSGRRRWNLRGALVVAQVAISIIVLICAGLFLRSLNKALKVDPGFSAENLVTMFLDPSLPGYDKAAGLRFYQELTRRIEAQPGVRAVSLATFLPLGGSGDGRGPIVKEGEADPPPNQGIGSSCSFVAPKYFATMRTPLVMGREFTEHDTADAPPVVIVNQEFARKFYGSEQNALGKRFRFWQGTPLMEIVGIAQDGYYGSLYEDRQTYMFLPEYQNYQSQMMLLVSANSVENLKAVVEHARREIGQMDARIPVFGVTMAEANLSYAYWGPRLAAGMATAFGLLALLLATMGLYSVMTYAVSQRTREIGIRMALGAQAGAVLRMVVWRGLRLTIVGMALGLAAAFGLTRVMKNLLFNVSATDPATFALIALLLVAIALTASYIPARRAAKIDPLQAIRHD